MLMWIQTHFEHIADAVVVLGAAMILLRFVSIVALKKTGLYDKLGMPRPVFFSDLLPLKLLCVKASEVGTIARIVFVTYAASYAGFLGALVLMIVGLGLR